MDVVGTVTFQQLLKLRVAGIHPKVAVEKLMDEAKRVSGAEAIMMEKRLDGGFDFVRVV